MDVVVVVVVVVVVGCRSNCAVCLQVGNIGV
jgi:hypothetical protein